jgi:hypothetical protein
MPKHVDELILGHFARSVCFLEQPSEIDPGLATELKNSEIDPALGVLNVRRVDADEAIDWLPLTGETGRDKSIAQPFTTGQGGLLFGAAAAIDDESFIAQQIKPDSPSLGDPKILGKDWKPIILDSCVAPVAALDHTNSVTHADKYDWRRLDRDIQDDKDYGHAFMQWSRSDASLTHRPDVAAIIATRKPKKYITLGDKDTLDWATVARVDVATWERVAARNGLAMPDHIVLTDDGAAIGFWPWVLHHAAKKSKGKTQRLTIVVTEGIKKALALLSQGIIAISIPGVWMGTAKRYKNLTARDDWRLQDYILSETIAAFRDAGCSITIAFDQDAKLTTRRDVSAAIRRLGFAMRSSHVSVTSWAIELGKGIDDVLVAGHDATEIIDTALPFTLWKSNYLASLHRKADTFIKRSELLHGKYIPDIAMPDAKIIAIKAPKGTGKTETIARWLHGITTLFLTHRNSLGAANAQRLNLESLADVSRFGGSGSVSSWLCVDSAHDKSQAKFNPDDWANCTIFFDEFVQFIWHLLAANTDIAKRRAMILSNVQQVIRVVLASPHGRIFLADADMNDTAIEFLAALAGIPIDALGAMLHLIEVEQKPVRRMAWRYNSPAKLFAAACDAIHDGDKILFQLSAQKVNSTWGTQTIETELRRRFPELRILRYDAMTVADRDHPAYQVQRNINQEIANWDVVIASPVLETGISIDVPHFDSVWAISHGGQSCDAFRQSLARYRLDCDRHWYAPDRATHGYIDASQSTSPRSLIESTDKKSQALRQQFRQWSELNDADFATIDGATECWAKMASHLNAQFLHFGDAIAAGLRDEGYSVTPTYAEISEAESDATREDIKAARDENCTDDSDLVAASKSIDEATRDARRKQSALTQTERYELRKADIADRLAIEPDAVTADDVTRDRDGWLNRISTHFYLTTGREYATELDRYRTGRSHHANGGIWAIDALRSNVSVRNVALGKLGFTALVQQWEDDPDREFTPSDFDDMATAWLNHERDARRWAIGAALNRDDDQLGVKLARSLFSSIGLKLAVVGRGSTRDDRSYRYKVVSELGDRDDGRSAIFARWEARYQTRIIEWELERNHDALCPDLHGMNLYKEDSDTSSESHTEEALQPVSKNDRSGGGEGRTHPKIEPLDTRPITIPTTLIELGKIDNVGLRGQTPIVMPDPKPTTPIGLLHWYSGMAIG